MDPTNVDVPAFHEGFSDLVALFLHFTYADVVEQAIRDSRGSFSARLAADRHGPRVRLRAVEVGKTNALRSGVDVDGIAAFDSDVPPTKARGPTAYDPRLEPHALGSVLVSAVFEAFATIVRRKVDRLFRIAGIDPQALGSVALSDALVKAIAQEASDVAGQFLNMCIRAMDYCPPADMELGEYLRALITADAEIEKRDKWGYREALMRSFRRREIFPDHVRFMTEDAVRWDGPSDRLHIPALAFSRLQFAGEPGRPASAVELTRQAHALGRFVTEPAHARVFQLVAPGARLPKGIVQAPPATVQSVRVARRATPDGRILFDIVAEVTQTCGRARRRSFRDDRRIHDRHRPGRRRAIRGLQESDERVAARGSTPRFVVRSHRSGRRRQGVGIGSDRRCSGVCTHGNASSEPYVFVKGRRG